MARSQSPPGESPSGAHYRQATLDDLDLLGHALQEVTFVVVDLETTGGSPADSEITEFGAVKVRGGEVLGEFQSLVRPRSPIPAFISVLTGITNELVADAEPIESVLPAFLSFSRDTVLVAHNAPFDIGFLKAACARTEHAWPGNATLDTARLARHAFLRDEVPNYRLASLARFVGSGTEPNHRALQDARATVDVLHAILERLGNQGIRTLEDLRAYTSKVTAAQRRKRRLADGLPSSPGVYIFRGRDGSPLYIGKSKDVRSRVRQYFVASEPRARMREMVALAESVDVVPCVHDLEAQVRELRLIAEHKPRYNRRSRFPERAAWLTLTDEPFPRLSLVSRQPDPPRLALGPFASRSGAEPTVQAIHEALPLRQCMSRLSARRRSPGCVLGQIGRCGAPCEGNESVVEYAEHVTTLLEAATGDPTAVLRPLRTRMDELARNERYEDAAVVRDRLSSFVHACVRSQRLHSLTSLDELVAARPAAAGAWDLAVIRRGRLVCAGELPRGAASAPVVSALRAAAERPPTGEAAAVVEETECLLRWLEQPGARLVSVAGTWSLPSKSPARWLAELSGPRKSRPAGKRYETESAPVPRARQPAAGRYARSSSGRGSYVGGP